MMPSLYHHFYVHDHDVVVELTWAPPAPEKRGALQRLARFLFGPDRSPGNVVNERAFDSAVELLTGDLDAACRAFADLGYRVTVDSEPELRCAA